MINEEDYIKSKISHRNPFTVPEGYFECLANQVMTRIPAKKPQKRSIIMRLRPVVYVAACICIGIFGIFIYQNLETQSSKNAQVNSAISQKSAELNDAFIDEATDYAMLGNEDIYASLLAEM